MDSKFEILQKAQTNGYYNAKREGNLSSGERHKLRATIEELEKLGYLQNSGSRIVYYITELGKQVLQSGSFEQFEKDKSESPELQAISETFKEIASLNSKYAEIRELTDETNQSVIDNSDATRKYSYRTLWFIGIQALATILAIILPLLIRRPQVIEWKTSPQVEKKLESQAILLDHTSLQIDSLTKELQILTKKLNSTSNHSLKNK
jgi:DNA-binding PadR family transcriptional regulator